jgi:hypothetical protein
MIQRAGKLFPTPIICLSNNFIVLSERYSVIYQTLAKHSPLAIELKCIQ